MKKLLSIAALVFAAASNTLANSAKDFAVQLPIQAASGASVQRLALPASALVAMQRADFGDVRVFNADGQAVPIALTSSQQTTRQTRSVELTALPVKSGAADALFGNGFSVSVESGKDGSKSVRVNESSKAKSTAPAERVVASLFDTRSITESLTAVEVDADVPQERPVHISLFSSADLKNWNAVADTVIYRSAITTANSTALLSFAPTAVRNQYLQLRWRVDGGDDQAVVVRSAKLTTQAESQPIARMQLEASAALASSHELAFALRFAAPVRSIHIQTQDSNALLPVRIQVRDSATQAWRELASTVVYSLVQNGSAQRNGPVELGAMSSREFRIEADKKSLGFAKPPRIVLEVDPVEIAFVATGNPPFTLAAARAKAESSFLPLASLVPGYSPGDEKRLALATVVSATESPTNAAAPITRIDTPAPATPTADKKTWILWGVLALGAFVLAIMAWILIKQMGQAPKQA
jgi:hypothetical protein